MHKDFTRLRAGQTVGEALDWLRRNPPSERIIYFYVVDEDGRLKGVVPTRRLVLSPPEALLTDIMVGKVIVVPSAATVLEACELFIQHRLLAFPVVDGEGHILGVVDIELYTDVLHHLDRATPAGRLVAPIVRFFRIEAVSGLVLLAATAVALLIANSPFAESFHSFWEQSLGFTAHQIGFEKTLFHWIDDGLMTIFFFVVGLEIKHEIVSGELADPRKALLPVVAAIGGMVVPAGLFALCMWGRDGSHGWGVPMATDIAFVVGFLTLLGPRVPPGLKILLLTLAIADDIGSVLVIAIAYSTDISFYALGIAGAGLALVVVLLQLGVRSPPIYFILAAAIWVACVKSGVHPTVAGVVLGLLTPARPLLSRRVLFDVVNDLYSRLSGMHKGVPLSAPETLSPVERLEGSLHPWVAFVVMPLFALVNAGVKIDPTAVATSMSLAVILGLVVGKPLGIFLFSWASVRIGATRLPEGVNWKVLLGAGCLGGIGFTMSLFIAALALKGDLLTEAKIGILTGSALSAILGCALLVAFLPRKADVKSLTADHK
jgi:NhaA family Na+:H+ antiporter